jgi:hypothetical protein
MAKSPKTKRRSPRRLSSSCRIWSSKIRCAVQSGLREFAAILRSCDS